MSKVKFPCLPRHACAHTCFLRVQACSVPSSVDLCPCVHVCLCTHGNTRVSTPVSGVCTIFSHAQEVQVGSHQRGSPALPTCPPLISVLSSVKWGTSSEPDSNGDESRRHHVG